MTPSLAMWMYVMVGGACGASLRYACYLWLNVGFGLPYGTLLVNAVGSLAAGALMAHALSLDPTLRHLIVIGLLGALTTMSTFSFEVVSLAQTDRWLAAAGYWLVTVIGCPLLAAAGYGFTRIVSQAN